MSHQRLAKYIIIFTSVCTVTIGNPEL